MKTMWFKKLVVFMPVYLFCVLNSKAQTNVYHPFPDSNAVWNVSYWAMWSGCWEDCSYTMNGDTVIGAFSYHKLLIPHLNRGGTCTLHPVGYNGCIRQDTAARLVFYVAPDSTVEEVLYDFNLQVGDSVFGIERFGCYSFPRPITQIDSILIGSNYRKRWKIASSAGAENSLIEGIGFTCGLLERCAINAVDFPYFRLTCFQQNGFTLYPDTNSSCVLIDFQTELPIQQSEILFSPNPFSDQLTLHFPNQLNSTALLRIFNSIGEAVLEKEIKLEDQTFNLGELPQGIYFASVRTEEGIFTTRLIK